ncbi:pyruvate kinase [Treponema pectinovorum]|uniref:pyruvate kinase n=1 Tax=Treponema pectinovorum TaxID=164 RepID=UPI003D8FBD58
MILQKTKIVCSIGPSSNQDETIRKMIQAGMNIARFNFSHGEHSWHKEAMDRVKRIAAQEKRLVAILLDTKGPEIRTGKTLDDKDISIKSGDIFEVTADDSPCYAAENSGNLKKNGHLSLTWKEATQKLKVGNKILVADGLIEFSVENIEKDKVICKALNNGTIGSRKNVNLVGVHAGLPIMSAQDKDDIAFGVEQNIDFIAASFVSFPEEVVEIRKYLKSLGSNAKIIAKIENEEGLNNIDRIIEEADGIMVARGDLGVQVPTERIPLAQKKIIRKCRQAAKTVITATQMLDSMVVNPRPTRAELTDVANAVIDGTDAVMLSGETAGGKYPVEAVETMSRIVRTTESSDEYRLRMRTLYIEEEKNYSSQPDKNIGKTVASTAYNLALNISAKAIISPTLHGNTSKMISSFRPEQIVIAVTPDEQVARQLMLNWGVNPILCEKVYDSETMIQNSIKVALDENSVAMSDSVVMIASIPLHSPLMANTIKVIVVGNVLARGKNHGYSNKKSPLAFGRIVNVEKPDEAIEFIRNSKNTILVCNRLTNEFIPLLRLVNGVIAESGSDLSAETLTSCSKNLVWLTDSPCVTASLETGLSVTIDGQKGLVYEGFI